MATKPVKVAFLADTADLRANLDKAGAAMDAAAAEAKTAGQKIDRSFDGVAESSDQLASGSAQVAGGLGDLGGALGMLPGPLGKVGTGMELLQGPIMGVTGASDLLNAATEKFPVLAKLSTAATKAQAVATRILGGAMRALPIFAIIGLIALLVAGFVIAYKRSETFRRIVNGSLDKVKAVAEKVARFFTRDVPRAFDKLVGAGRNVLGWVRGNWPKLLAILTGPIGLAVLFFKSKLGKDLLGWLGGLPGRIKGKTAGMWDGIKQSFRSALNWIIDGWNGLSFTLPSINTHIPGIGTVGGFTLSTPNIPRLARGGITTGPTLALIGDNPGGREAVIPLDQYRLGGDTINLYLNGTFVGATKAEVGRWLTEALDEWRGTGGRRLA